ncbi:MAG TPA: NlpC/P60 family protein [Candidatus Saccharimonadales bacterium]|nr:NlpC/P60 family protein [Candidatus Saccharimonadales bacterium]
MKYLHATKCGRALLTLGFIGFWLLFNTGAVAALPQDQINALNTGIYYFDTNDSIACSFPITSTSSAAPPSQTQINNAKTVIGIAKTDNLGQQGALIGLMVGLAESGLHNLANANMPVSLSAPGQEGDNQGQAHDYDSVGVFQQRISTGWSTLAPGNSKVYSDPAASQNYSNGFPQAVYQVMTPAYAAQAFFGSPPGAKMPSALSKGLQNIGGWQTMQPWEVAQKVQGSAFSSGSNYRNEMPAAQALLNQYWATAPAVPLPVALNSGTTTATPTSTTLTCPNGGSSSTATQAVIQAGLDEISKNIPYVLGGGGPTGPSGSPAGFDCSSFMQYVFFQGANISLPRTAQQQYDATVGQGHTVPKDTLQAGDLLFYGSSPTNIQHVALYIGSGQIIEAAHTGTNLLQTQMYDLAAPGEPLQGIGYYPPIGGIS